MPVPVYTPVYTMDIEKPGHIITQHPFHLGTQRQIAESFVLELLNNDPQIVSIALRFNHELVRIYDSRDLD